MTNPEELGRIAACAADVSGQAQANPYRPGTTSHTRFKIGYDDELKKLKSEVTPPTSQQPPSDKSGNDL